MTLTELLVAIGIVGLLALLTLKGTGEMRERSKQVKCLAQLKQIVYALGLYADENEGRLPATPLDGVVDENEMLDGTPDLPVMLAHYGLDETAFRCPSDPVAYFQDGFGSSYYFSLQPGMRLFETYFGTQPIDPTTMTLIGEGMYLHRKANNKAYLDGHVALERP
ncbi:MAG: hypothetical protein HY360_08015 [Verrucomicrobia bacterium]|nr:hypothetical protein [Verrucomicrobiota bacterium]